MRKTATIALLILASGAGLYLALEGGYALSKGMKPSRSLTCKFLDRLLARAPDAGELAREEQSP